MPTRHRCRILSRLRLAAGLRLLALAVVVLAVSLPAVSGDALAQSRPRTLFDLLFGRPRVAEPVPEADAPAGRVPRKKKRPVATAADGTPVPAKPAAVAKAVDARRILVVGDFLASSLGEGLKSAYEQAGDVVVEARSNVASGLTRDDYYDWQAELPAMIEAVKPVAVVVLIGANDRQAMRLGDTREKYRTERWLAAYQTRVAALADKVRSRNLPLYWVGLPAFRQDQMTADVAQLNGFYRAATEKAGGEFVDIWEGFVDENGKFVVTGSDINGQQVRLRSGDGLNMTKAGRRKMAFYVEKALKKLLGETGLPSVAPLASGTLLAPQGPVGPAADAKPAVVLRTPPIALTDPELDGGSSLLGAEPAVAKAGVTPPATPSAFGLPPARDVLSGRVTPPVPPKGRVDNFSLE